MHRLMAMCLALDSDKPSPGPLRLMKALPAGHSFASLRTGSLPLGEGRKSRETALSLWEKGGPRSGGIVTLATETQSGLPLNM
jgi:hypothetical protein